MNMTSPLVTALILTLAIGSHSALADDPVKANDPGKHRFVVQQSGTFRIELVHVDMADRTDHHVKEAKLCVEKGTGAAWVGASNNCRGFGTSWAGDWDVPMWEGNQLTVWRKEDNSGSFGETSWKGGITQGQTMNDPHWVNRTFQAHFRVTKK